MTYAFHQDERTTPPDDLDQLTTSDAPGRHDIVDAYVSSPMYRVIDEHAVAWLALAILVAGYALLRRRRPHRLAAYDARPLLHRVEAWLLAGSAIVHAGLIFSHEPSAYTVLYAAGAAAPWWVQRRLLAGRRWRREAVVVLGGLIGGWCLTMVAGESPDQVSVLAKFAELAALMIAVQPVTRTRVRRAAATATTVVVAGMISVSAWVGAFSNGTGHHLGDTPEPGALIPVGRDREPTDIERAAAERLHEATVAGIAPFADVATAAAAGYRVEGLSGVNFHADNDALKGDDQFLDPAHPETLVYAVGASGDPVLLGAMFQMDHYGQIGPAIGGPLTVWHAHDHICLGLVPPGQAGLTSPFGVCPLGSITIPVTNEMIHVWTVPGIEDPFEDLDDVWLAEFLASR